MATPHSDEHHEPAATAWSKFAAEEQHELMKDDSSAWNDVTKILLTIVAIGLALSFLTLYLSRDRRVKPVPQHAPTAPASPEASGEK